MVGIFSVDAEAALAPKFVPTVGQLQDKKMEAVAQDPAKKQVVSKSGSSKGILILLTLIAIALFAGAFMLYGITTKSAPLATTNFQLAEMKSQLATTNSQLAEMKSQLARMRSKLAPIAFNCYRTST